MKKKRKNQRSKGGNWKRPLNIRTGGGNKTRLGYSGHWEKKMTKFQTTWHHKQPTNTAMKTLTCTYIENLCYNTSQRYCPTEYITDHGRVRRFQGTDWATFTLSVTTSGSASLISLDASRPEGDTRQQMSSTWARGRGHVYSVKGRTKCAWQIVSIKRIPARNEHLGFIWAHAPCFRKMSKTCSHWDRPRLNYGAWRDLPVVNFHFCRLAANWKSADGHHISLWILSLTSKLNERKSSG